MLAEINAEVQVPSEADLTAARKLHQDTVLPVVHETAEKKQDARNNKLDKN